jgi:thiazole synthase
MVSTLNALDPLTISGRQFSSRLFTGTGKYSDLATMQASIERSGCEMVTVAVRRVQAVAASNADEAVRVARLGRELAKLAGQEDNNFVKLEVIPDSRHLLPDPIGTLEAAERLVNEGFAVLPYINADPLLAKRLEEAGCATVMPLGSPIGSGQGLNNAANIRLIVENASVPVVVDAGIGVPSEAAQALELGADAVLVNSAIALAGSPAAMAEAMGQAVKAGRLAYSAGRLPRREEASASSPTTGMVS